MVHGESIAGEVITCQQCGEEATFPPSTAEGRKYCSEECMSEAYEDKATLACEACGDEYTVPRSQESTSRFCSRDCALPVLAEKRQNRVPVECSTCGESFRTHPHRVEQQDCHFCDHDCYAEWLSENRSGKNNPHWEGGKPESDCANCGSETTQHHGNAKKTDRAFCDRSCYMEWHSENMVGESSPRWKGGRTSYGKGWSEPKRETVRKRDGRECIDCGMLEADHVDKFDEKLHVHHIIPAREIDDAEERNGMDNLITLCRTCHLGKWEQIPGLKPA